MDLGVWWRIPVAAVVVLLLAPVLAVLWANTGVDPVYFEPTIAYLCAGIAIATARGDWFTRWVMPALLFLMGWPWLVAYTAIRGTPHPWARRLVHGAEWFPRRLGAVVRAPAAVGGAPRWPRPARANTMAGLFLASLLVCTGLAFYPGSGNVVGIDGQWYLAAAQTLLEKHEFVAPHPVVNDGSQVPSRATRTPGYPLFLAGCRLLAGRHQVTAASAIQCVAVAATAVVVFLAAEWLAGSLAGLLAGALIVCYAPLAWFAPLILTEALTVFLITAVVCLLLRAVRLQTAGSMALAGAVMGVATWVRPNTLFAPALLFIIYGLLALRRRSLAPLTRQFAPLALAFTAVMAPWWIRNAIVLHAFVPAATIGGTQAWGGNIMRFKSVGRDYNIGVATQVLHRCGDDEVRADRELLRMAKAQMLDNLRHPRELLVLFQCKVEILVLRACTCGRLSRGARAVHLVLLTMGLAGFLMLRRQQASAVMAAVFIAYVGPILATYAGESRYFLPMAPLLAIWAGAVLAALVD